MSLKNISIALKFVLRRLCKRFVRFIESATQKKFTHWAGCKIKSMRPIFTTKMLIYQSKANLDEKILFGEITHHLDSEIGKCW